MSSLLPYYVRQKDRAPRVTAPIDPDPGLPKVCIIGAGPCGLTAAKHLHENRVPFDCFELGPQLGGVWVFNNPNGINACYDSLHTNTSTPRMAYSDFPMPVDYPHYPSHWQVLAYLESYVHHFNFGHTITFNTEVTEVKPSSGADGTRGWEVTIRDGQGQTETRHYDAVIVANGHHWDARWPREDEYPGEFAGDQIHAHDYRHADQLAGRDVLVVGVGSSGLDIASEAARVARTANISVRHSEYIMKKSLLGGRLASDQLALPGWVPRWLSRLRIGIGAGLSEDLTKYGFPEVDHKPAQSRPIQSDTIHKALASGRLSARPGIQEFAGDRVIFTDGTWAPADLIVWATGYRITFPFLDTDLVDPSSEDFRLWLQFVDPKHPGLFFLGLLQALGSLIPLAEAQARILAKVFTGQIQLPEPAELAADIAENNHLHQMKVDFDPYLADLHRAEHRLENKTSKANKASKATAPPEQSATG